MDRHFGTVFDTCARSGGGGTGTDHKEANNSDNLNHLPNGGSGSCFLEPLEPSRKFNLVNQLQPHLFECDLGKQIVFFLFFKTYF